MRPEGIRLAGAVMVVDVIATWIVSWPQLLEDPAGLLRPVGLLPITLFGLVVVVSSAPLIRTTKRTLTPLACSWPEESS